MAKLEDPYERLLEPYAIQIANQIFSKNNQFLDEFPIEYSLSTSISLYNDISWTEMKSEYNWGFSKGNILGDGITWIYIRPDIFLRFNSNIVGGAEGLIRKGYINQHYFVVKTKAVDYFKSKCSNLIERPSANDDYYSSSAESTPRDRRSLARRLIDDEAKEDY